MRPTRGNTKASIAEQQKNKRTRPCVVLLRKVKPELTSQLQKEKPDRKSPLQKAKPASKSTNRLQKEAAPTIKKIEAKKEKAEESKTPIEPLKKRPIEIKKIARGRKSNNLKMHDNTTIAVGRSRRMPKPNPKYSNASLVTPSLKSSFGRYTDDDVSDRYESSDFDVEPSDHEASSEEDFKGKNRQYNTSLSNLNTAKRRRISRITPTFDKQFSSSLRQDNKIQSVDSQVRKRKLDLDKESVESSIIARNKRLNIELYDSIDSPFAAKSSDKYPRNKNTSTTSSAKLRTMAIGQKVSTALTSTQKNMAGNVEEIRKSLLKPTKSKIEEKPVELSKPASTQDDFETMPTFTIVNINDIINKKGDVLIEQAPKMSESTSVSPQHTRNRRKTGHTTILSDKVDPTKIIEPRVRSPFPPKKQQTVLNNNNISKNLVQPREKPAPRILNSMVGKKTPPVTPMITNCDTKTSSPNTTNHQILLKAKENVEVNAPKPVQRKLPPEKVIIQRQGNKLVKKITCFEIWHVLNVPKSTAYTEKNSLGISLVALANTVRDIKLPSEEWNYKISVQQLTPNQFARGNFEKFTGDIDDPTIPESKKHQYQPSNVMFRRTSAQKEKARLPYDRAVIFKNRTFFTNIDGKNVKLIGAPSCINTLEDVEILLCLVDELFLGSSLVEPTTTA